MPSDPVYVSIKITAVDELCNDKLLKGGNSARIKSKLFLKDLYKDYNIFDVNMDAHVNFK